VSRGNTHDCINARQRCFPSALFINSSSSFISFSYVFSESSGKVFIVCSNISSSILVTDRSVESYLGRTSRTLLSVDLEEVLLLVDSSRSGYNSKHGRFPNRKAFLWLTSACSTAFTANLEHRCDIIVILYTDIQHLLFLNLNNPT
jgi:hypothetical protein